MRGNKDEIGHDILPADLPGQRKAGDVFLVEDDIQKIYIGILRIDLCQFKDPFKMILIQVYVAIQVS
jgi:hypothetical protein